MFTWVAPRTWGHITVNGHWNACITCLKHIPIPVFLATQLLYSYLSKIQAYSLAFSLIPERSTSSSCPFCSGQSAIAKWCKTSSSVSVRIRMGNSTSCIFKRDSSISFSMTHMHPISSPCFYLNDIILACDFQLCARLRRCASYSASARVFTVGEWWFTSYWTFRAHACQSGCWQIHCLAVPSFCTRLLCLARLWIREGAMGVGVGGVPGSSSPPTSPNPRSSKTTMIRRERWEEVAGCKKKKKPSSDSQSQSCGAPQILQQKLHCMLQPRPWYLTVTQGYSCLTCTAFQRLFLEKKVCIHGGRFKAKWCDTVIQPVLLQLLFPSHLPSLPPSLQTSPQPCHSVRSA